jgi:hypothetical protein
MHMGIACAPLPSGRRVASGMPPKRKASDKPEEPPQPKKPRGGAGKGQGKKPAPKVGGAELVKTKQQGLAELLGARTAAPKVAPADHPRAAVAGDDEAAPQIKWNYTRHDGGDEETRPPQARPAAAANPFTLESDNS